ncbi:Zinc finger BED domain-containing protein 4 [Mycena venus]|uniref:Zinc finger BED domain-containing protein 4 n=1 Tax=Mycena venus TaxID=2733690 RepID=A0A8H6Z3G1_9AGAR|nr:Zinc finger BED domain-containing protein 4 [Mycena venus]
MSRKRSHAQSTGSGDESVRAQSSCTSSPGPADTNTTADSTGANAAREKRLRFEARYKMATTSDKDVLAAQQANWTSKVYDHFRAPEILTEGGEIKYKFVCKAHPMSFVTRARHDDGTSNLRRHVLSCVGIPAAASSGSIKSFAIGSKYTPASHHMKIALWVARRHRPFLIVEDPELLDIFLDLNNRIETPSASTVSRDVKEIFQMSQKCVGALLQSYPGRLHLCIDGWTAPQVISFLSLTITWICEAKMESLILDFVKAGKAHTGIYLASCIAECLREYGIEKKILSIVGDNASNNDTMIDELADLIPTFPGKTTRVHCFAHILNLVVKAILSQFSYTKKAATTDADPVAEDDEDDEEEVKIDDLLSDELGDEEEFEEELEGEGDDDKVDPAVQASDDAAIADAAAEVNLEGWVPLLQCKDINLGCYAILKLCTLAKKVFHSPTPRIDLFKACKKCDVAPLLMVRNVSTQWNSTAMLLKRAVELKEPLKMLVGMEVHNCSRSARLGHFKLSKKEWELLEELEPLLDVFLVATEEVSHSRIPLIHDVIHIYDIITGALDDFIDGASRPLTIRAAALRGLTMLNKYYSLTNESVVYRIAVVLHPKHKTTYFSKAKWPWEWIQTAEMLVREEWEWNYKPKSSINTASTSKSKDTTTTRNKYFAALHEDDLMDVDPLDDWIRSAPVITTFDPIAW